MGNEYRLADVVKFLHEHAEPGTEGRAIVTDETLRKARASLTCYCPACIAEDREAEDDVKWG